MTTCILTDAAFQASCAPAPAGACLASPPFLLGLSHTMSVPRPPPGSLTPRRHARAQQVPRRPLARRAGRAARRARAPGPQRQRVLPEHQVRRARRLLPGRHPADRGRHAAPRVLHGLALRLLLPQAGAPPQPQQPYPTLPYPTYPTLPYPTASALCGGRKQQAAAAASSNSSKQLLPKVLARLSRRSPQTCSGVRPGGAPSSPARWLWRSKAYYRRGSEHASQSGNLWMAIWLCRASLVQREEGRQNAPGAINMLPVLAKCHGC